MLVFTQNVVASSSGGCADVKDTHFTRPFQSQGYNSKLSWHLDMQHVPRAWTVSQGQGVTIGQIDTGVFEDQNLLTGSLFYFGEFSGNRRIIRKDFSGTLSIGGWGHGTGVAGVMVAPVNNVGALTGVAYKSSLVTYRANELPALLSNASVKKFSAALKAMADRSDVRIINISMGKLKKKDRMLDAIEYAYNKGKLIFASTGYLTGEEGGVYPAKFNGFVQAVTGVQYRESDPNGFDLRIAGSNPYGSYVDFAGYVFRASDGACALVLDKKGYAPKSGIGSSYAAATTSGIAALVWSANPELTREEVVSILRRSGSYASSPSQDFGYGVIDAEKAVRLAVDAL
ncbi:Thermitase [Thalassocella blandensis]|nr:Thermitase [Thalassocella blandensis]